MKKYEKPTIVIERFELSHSIANCDLPMAHAQESCTYDSDELGWRLGVGETVFTDGSCTYSIQYFLNIYEDYCLQTMTPGQTLFTS